MNDNFARRGIPFYGICDDYRQEFIDYLLNMNFDDDLIRISVDHYYVIIHKPTCVIAMYPRQYIGGRDNG